jgi:hypothetical protein
MAGKFQNLTIYHDGRRGGRLPPAAAGSGEARAEQGGPRHCSSNVLPVFSQMPGALSCAITTLSVR